MIGPVVSGGPVVSRVMLIGQAPGDKEGPAGKPFAWTAGKTMFGWFSEIGLSEEQFRASVYMAAVCRCFPGKAEKGGDRVPSPDEIQKCSRHIASLPTGMTRSGFRIFTSLAIAQLYPDLDKLTEIIGEQRRGTIAGHTCDVIALPHPSGASTWHRTEPGKTLLAQALGKIARHEAWKSLVKQRDVTLAAATVVL